MLARLTSRQRFALALSRLTQEELDAVVKRPADDAANGDTKAVHALCRLADQAFGPTQVEPPTDPHPIEDKQWQELTESERATVRADLIEQALAANDPSDPRDGHTSTS